VRALSASFCGLGSTWFVLKPRDVLLAEMQSSQSQLLFAVGRPICQTSSWSLMSILARGSLPMVWQPAPTPAAGSPGAHVCSAVVRRRWFHQVPPANTSGPASGKLERFWSCPAVSLLVSTTVSSFLLSVLRCCNVCLCVLDMFSCWLRVFLLLLFFQHACQLCGPPCRMGRCLRRLYDLILPLALSMRCPT